MTAREIPKELLVIVDDMGHPVLHYGTLETAKEVSYPGDTVHRYVLAAEFSAHEGKPSVWVSYKEGESERYVPGLELAECRAELERVEKEIQQCHEYMREGVRLYEEDLAKLAAAQAEIAKLKELFNTIEKVRLHLDPKNLFPSTPVEELADNAMKALAYFQLKEKVRQL